jgi:hypothetical protein
LLFASFIIIFIFTAISQGLINKYPFKSAEDCQNLVGSEDPALMQSQAIMEYENNFYLESEGKSKSVSYAGYVQCFCDANELDGALPDATYGDKNTLVCQAYKEAYLPTQITTNGITVLIVVINIILKMSTISLISWIGYDTHSELMTKITNGVFLVLFFNTGLLLLLVNANLADISDWLSNIFDATYYDYSPNWYASVGSTLV